ncbi:MAG: PKD domain-containing protein [Bacteroidetes bacterium]|nr:PKD domain-containing protein [Bacteroidota bacterium]
MRLRFASDAATQPAPSPCNDVTFGQHEDYYIKILQNTAIPVADFTVSDNFICFAGVTFTDLSTNAVYSWLWDFGDGDTSHAQNPAHTYSQAGIYTVTLTASNSFGSNTKVESNYITVSAGPQAPSCSPVVTSYCCGSGIYRVQLNTLDNPSFHGSVGSQDFSCNAGTNLMVGAQYFMQVQTNPSAPENVRAWIDFNDDGMFDPVTEEIFSSDTTLQWHSQYIFVPNNAVQNKTLRMRISSDFHGMPVPTPCADVISGQIEDYSITLVSNPLQPQANFITDKELTCDGCIRFTDRSANVPAQWFWEFGDGNTSSFQNPLHCYTTNGTYSVKLTVSNSAGQHDTIFINLIQVNIGAEPVPTECQPNTLNINCVGYGIYNVTFVDINNSSDCGAEGYRDFSCEYSTEILEGKTYLITIDVNPVLEQDTRIWVDINNDSIFDPVDELVFRKDNVKNKVVGTIRIPGNMGPLDQALRMRIMSDNAGQGQGMINACIPPDFGQVEDYSVILKENTLPPDADFTLSYPNPCGLSVQFKDSTENVVDEYLWDFGDGTKSKQRNPLHYYHNPGTYTVKLKVKRFAFEDSITKFSIVKVDTLCSYNMPTTGLSITNDCYGLLFDDGGPIDDYFKTANGIFVINPPNATSVTLTFYQPFIFEGNGDFLFIYQGVGDSVSNLLGAFTGTISPGVITTQPGFGAITLKMTTNGNASVGLGFNASWSCSGPPESNFDYDPSLSDLCKGVYQMVDLSRRATSWDWLFGISDAASDKYPTYTLRDSTALQLDTNIMTVQLIVSNSHGKDTSWLELPVHKTFPAWDTTMANQLTVEFHDKSIFGILDWSWSFGDGDSSFIKSPKHTYSGLDKFDVRLRTRNDKCSNSKKVIIDLRIVDIENFKQNKEFVVYPNPAVDQAFVRFTLDKAQSVSITSVVGQELFTTTEVNDGTIMLDITDFNAGVYFVTVTTEYEQITRKLLIVRR